VKRANVQRITMRVISGHYWPSPSIDLTVGPESIASAFAICTIDGRCWPCAPRARTIS